MSILELGKNSHIMKMRNLLFYNQTPSLPMERLEIYKMKLDVEIVVEINPKGKLNLL